ncbi:hypothetical protein F5146DRAFT_1002326 [Armillaria mellea]|nr:hypothetical protein F5146DRAFT_1002326 [Armillaria mellea]
MTIRIVGVVQWMYQRILLRSTERHIMRIVVIAMPSIATESTRNDRTTIEIRQVKDTGAGAWIPILHGEKQFELSELNSAVQFRGGTSAFDLNWMDVPADTTEEHIMLIVVVAMSSIATESTRNDGTTIEIRQVKDTGADLSR